MPWYMKGINTVNALASDPLTTLERGLLEWERPLAFQGLQSTDPSIVGDDARFYDRALNRDENFLNNTLNYINPFRAASSAGQNLQQGDYGDAVVDFATIIPMLKGAKAGWRGFTGLNNALTNNVNGINTKIAETKRKGMVYQSTLDELNALNTQKEILRADEAKRKALEAQERQRQQQLRTVGSDNTRVDNSIIKNSSVNFQLPYERAETITKAQKDAARQIVTSGDFGNYFPEQMNYYLSKENSHRQGGPLTLEELALQQIRTNPDFFQSLEEKKYQDFQKREQKTYDTMFFWNIL